MTDPQPPTLPQSDALTEATADSLTELLARDPEGYTRQDRDRIVAALRQSRAAREAAEAASPTRAKGRGSVAEALAKGPPPDLGKLGL